MTEELKQKALKMIEDGREDVKADCGEMFDTMTEDEIMDRIYTDIEDAVHLYAAHYKDERTEHRDVVEAAYTLLRERLGWSSNTMASIKDKALDLIKEIQDKAGADCDLDTIKDALEDGLLLNALFDGDDSDYTKAVVEFAYDLSFRAQSMADLERMMQEVNEELNKRLEQTL